MAIRNQLEVRDVVNYIRDLTVMETKNLIFYCGVKIKYLDDIEKQYRSVEDQKIHFVQKWIDCVPDANLQMLPDALIKIGKLSLAQSLQHQILSNSAAVTSNLDSAQINTTGSSLALQPMQAFQPSSIPDPRVNAVKEQIEAFKTAFTNLMLEAQKILSREEKADPGFLDYFTMYILALPVSKKGVHINFFRANEAEILEAGSVRKILAVLNRYCSYYNYEIIFCIIEGAGGASNARFLTYRQSFTDFEKMTTVEVFLKAVSASPQGGVCQEFIEMTLKLNKPASVCTLHEIRQLRETIAEEASLHSYSVYIDRKEVGSVRVVLRIQPEAAILVAAIMTAKFKKYHNLTDVTIAGKAVEKYNNMVRFLSEFY